MDPALRVVTRIPMTELWNEAGPLSGSRGEALTLADLQQRLRRGPVRFVVADLGAPLRWLPASACFDFWKSEAKEHIADPETIRYEDFPDGYCYVASKWRLEAGQTIVLLEMYH